MRRFGAGLGVPACAAAMLLSAPARAADMAPPSYYPPAPLSPALYDWTGVYVGGNVGAGLLSDAWTQSIAAPPTSFAGTIKVAPAALVGGAQAGLNYQLKALVVGIQGSWTDSAITGNGTANTIPADSLVRGTSAPLWFATATGRVGFADNAWLFYVKGGGAWMNVKYTENVLTGSVTIMTQGLSATRSGYTAGLGVEFGMTENLSAIVEYDFFGFGTKDYNFNITPVGIRSDLNTLTAGLNYRFNWAGWR